MDVADDRIQNNPTPRALQEDADQLRVLQQAWPLLAPLVSALGVNVEEVQGLLNSHGHLPDEIENLISLPDRFNAVFATRGFIAYDLLNLETLRTALDLAEAGQVDEAEQRLVDHYTPEQVAFHLRTMQAVQAFQLRMPLAQLAQLDYAEERYHACVPVVLALIDGLVNDLTPEHQGLSAESTKLTAWDSIAAHSTGLGVLIRAYRKTRRKVRTENLSFPYRNGILHGMDLGYGNRTVAAKSWALLFAVREWAAKVEAGEHQAPPPNIAPEPSLQELLLGARERQQQNQRLQEMISAWQPRSLVVGQSLPASGPPDVYEDGSPEQVLAQFMLLWQRRNYGAMAGLMPGAGQRGKKTAAVHPQEVRENYGTFDVHAYRMVQVDDQGAAATNIDVDIFDTSLMQAAAQRRRMRFIYMDETGFPPPRTLAGGRWVLYTSWRVWDEEPQSWPGNDATE